MQAGALLASVTGTLAPRRLLSVVAAGALIGALAASPAKAEVRSCRPWRATKTSGFPVNSYFQGVSAISSTDVWAVGVNGGGNIIGHWDDSGWARVASNDPNATFLDVAAISPTDAWAVGFYGDPQGRFNTARVLHWDGMTWAHYPAPPGGSYAFLYGVSADSATDVWAVGWWDASNGSIHPLVLHFDGTAWTQVPAVSPTGGDEFESVAALAP